MQVFARSHHRFSLCVVAWLIAGAVLAGPPELGASAGGPAGQPGQAVIVVSAA